MKTLLSNNCTTFITFLSVVFTKCFFNKHLLERLHFLSHWRKLMISWSRLEYLKILQIKNNYFLQVIIFNKTERMTLIIFYDFWHKRRMLIFTILTRIWMRNISTKRLCKQTQNTICLILYVLLKLKTWLKLFLFYF